jgi:hypothetical protein
MLNITVTFQETVVQNTTTIDEDAVNITVIEKTGTDANVTQENIENALPYTIAKDSEVYKYINPVNYGANPNDSTDDTTAFSLAIQDAITQNKTFKPSPGKYYVNELSIPSNLRMDLSNVEIHNSVDPSGQVKHTFKIQGTKTGVSTTVAETPIWGGTDNAEAFLIKVVDTNSFAVGDDVLFEIDTASDVIDYIDFNKIEEIVDATTLRMERVVMIYPWTVGTVITKVHLIKNVEILNGKFTGLQTATNGVYPSGGGAAIFAEYASNIALRNITGTAQKQTIQTSYVYDIRINNLRVYDNRIFGSLFTKTISLQLSQYSAEGNGQGGLILGSVKHSSISNINIHNNGRLDGSGDNIQIGRADGINISNGSIYRSECYGIWILNHSENVNLQGLEVYRGSTGGINITDGSNKITVNGCHIFENFGSGVMVGNSTDDPVKNISVINNKIEKSSGDWSFLAQSVDWLQFSNNEVIHTGTNKVNITNTCTNTRVENNLVNGTITDTSSHAPKKLLNIGGQNLVDVNDISIGYVNNTNGVFASTNSQRSTNYIAVKQLMKYVFSTSDKFKFPRIVWFDINKTYISGEVFGSNENNLVREAPTGAAFLRFSSGYESFDYPELWMIQQGEIPTYYSPKPLTETQLRETTRTITAKQTFSDISVGTGANGSYTTTDGKTVTVTDGIITSIV